MKKFQVIFEGEYTDAVPLFSEDPDGDMYDGLKLIRLALEKPDPKQSLTLTATFVPKEFDSSDEVDEAIEKWVQENG